MNVLRASFVLLMLSIASVQFAESRKLLKLAAAAAIIRGGPIIPIPVRYPVHVPHSKVVKVPVHHPVPVKVPVRYHSHSVKKVPVPVHSHSIKHVPVPVHSHHHPEKAIALPVHHEEHGGNEIAEFYGGYGDGHEAPLGYENFYGSNHGHFDGHGGLIGDIGFGGHGW